jgi:hypothetical protein
LARFGIRPVAGTNAADGVRWRGGPSPLLVSDDAPYSLELARALEPLLGSPGNEVRTTPVARSSWLEARRSRHFGLLLDFVRAPNGDLAQSSQALLCAVDPALAKRPPKNPSSLLDATRTLTLGIVGEARVTGARGAQLEALDAWQLGAVWLDPSKQ